MRYYLYILKTVNDTLYCGIALDVMKRFREHLTSKKGAKYTKSHPPKEIVYLDCFLDRSSASKEEYRIKHTLSKAQKLELIEQNRKKTEKLLDSLKNS